MHCASKPPTMPASTSPEPAVASHAGASVQIPYLVVGCGGHAASAVTAASGQHMNGTIFEKSLQGYGYVLVTASAAQLSIEMIETTGGVKKSFDKVTTDISTHRVT